MIFDDVTVEWDSPHFTLYGEHGGETYRVECVHSPDGPDILRVLAEDGTEVDDYDEDELTHEVECAIIENVRPLDFN